MKKQKMESWNKKKAAEKTEEVKRKKTEEAEEEEEEYVKQKRQTRNMYSRRGRIGICKAEEAE